MESTTGPAITTLREFLILPRAKPHFLSLVAAADPDCAILAFARGSGACKVLVCRLDGPERHRFTHVLAECPPGFACGLNADRWLDALANGPGWLTFYALGLFPADDREAVLFPMQSIA